MKRCRSIVIVLAAWAALCFATGPRLTRAADAPATKPATQAATDAGPISHLAHTPQQPKPGEPVKVTASIAAGVKAVTLEYQIVEPGAYVELKDPEYAQNWVKLPMTAGATAKDRTAFSADLPATLQKRRRLIRYRVRATDAAGQPLLCPVIPPVPAGENGQPARPETPSNEAYFVYDAIPAWSGAINPNANNPRLAKPVTFPPETMSRVQPYFLIGRKESVENATWHEQAGGKEYKYTGTLVVNGVCFDHVRFRARGGVWRYAVGKNMWKFDLQPGEHLHAVDDFGRPFPVTWNKVNLRSIIQLGSYGRRGEQGMYEAVGFRLFNLAGVPACNTAWVQLRIVDEPDETPADQYKGDFWGLYLAIENEDGRFLKTHDLPDGNLFKMANGGGELNHSAPGQPTDSSDLRKFLDTYNGQRTSDDWWRENLNLDAYYSYRAILECIHHYDVAEGKNYDYYHNPQTGKWQVIPWDLDLTWADHMYGNGDEPFRGRVLSRPAFRLAYQNRLREIRDLLFNPEQTGQLIDEYASVIGPTAPSAPSLAEADRRKWDYHPALANGGQGGNGQYYQASTTHDFRGMVQQMKDYVQTRGAWVDATLLNDAKVPATPAAIYLGPADHAADQLKFRPSPYKGQSPFAAVKWRLAEVSPMKSPPGTPRTARLYEITPTWESEELPHAEEITLPPDAAKPGHLYRVRVRTKDTTGRWGHWSPPIEFVAGKALP